MGVVVDRVRPDSDPAILAECRDENVRVLPEEFGGRTPRKSKTGNVLFGTSVPFSKWSLRGVFIIITSTFRRPLLFGPLPAPLRAWIFANLFTVVFRLHNMQ